MSHDPGGCFVTAAFLVNRRNTCVTRARLTPRKRARASFPPGIKERVSVGSG